MQRIDLTPYRSIVAFDTPHFQEVADLLGLTFHVYNEGQYQTQGFRVTKFHVILGYQAYAVCEPSLLMFPGYEPRLAWFVGRVVRNYVDIITSRDEWAWAERTGWSPCSPILRARYVKAVAQARDWRDIFLALVQDHAANPVDLWAIFERTGI